MSVASHRAALAAQIAAVADIGRVHDHEVYARTEAAFRDFYVWQAGDGTEQLRGWFLRRVRTAESNGGLQRTINAHTWQLRGFMSLDEATDSERAFDTLIEAVRKAYRDDITVGGAAQPGPLNQASGWQLTDSTPVVFVGVLCHAATLTLTTYELLDSGE